MSKKRAFLLYDDQREAVNELSDEDAGKVLKAAYAYSAGEEPELTGEAKIAFRFIRVAMDRDMAAYQARCQKNSSNGKKGGRPAKMVKPAASSELFETFWAAYPRKAAKADARKAFGKITQQTLEEVILPDLERRKLSDQWKEKNGAFIPYPATYLRGERWNDQEPKTQKRSFKERTVTDDDFKDMFLPL